MIFKNPSFQVDTKEPNWFSKMLLNIELKPAIHSVCHNCAKKTNCKGCYYYSENEGVTNYE